MATSIVNTLAAGSVASPYFYDCVIQKQLCRKTPAAKAPVFVPTFNVVGTSLVGTSQYEITINVQGIISYTPCGECCTKSQMINENFVIPYYGTAAPESVTVSGSVIRNSIQTSGCSNCGNIFKSDCALTVTITTT